MDRKKLTNNPKIISIKVKNYPGVAETNELENVIKAIAIAEENGADICNLSISTTIDDISLKQSIKKSNMLFVVSAGNSEVQNKRNVDYTRIYPASFKLDNIISVANCNNNRKLAVDSNYGQNSIDLAAPGSDIASLSLENNYSKVSGSSFAVPHVTGIAAIMYAYMRSPTPIKVKECLMDSVTKLPQLENKLISGGIVDGARALTYVLEK